MKKITLMAALLGSVYFANAQVGIGTPSPKTSAMLDIEATDKGVLIPRVNLAVLNVFAPVVGTQENGLLVFATGKKYTSETDKTLIDSDVTSGFYYWNANKWERIVNQTQLDQVISNQADITKIKNLLNAAYGSNNLGDTATSDTFGGMVYTPAIVNGDNPATPGVVETDYNSPAKFEYVKYVNGNYTRVDATAGLVSLIQGNETKTSIVTIKNVQYYLSESFNKSTELAAATTDEAKYLVLFPTSGAATTGFFKIDVVGGVVNNFNDILTSTVETTINGETQTVKEYFESLGALEDGVTKIVLNAITNQASFQQWNGTAWVTVDTSAFSAIVKANETGTTIAQSKDGGAYDQVVVDSKGADKIVYEYAAENGVKNYLPITDDLKWSIENNEDIKNIIKNLSLTSGANVGYTTTEISVANNTVGGTAGALIPAKSFYYVNGAGIKVKIEMSDIVLDATTVNNNSSVEHKNNVTKIKQNLGDKLTNTSVFTGDTVNVGGTEYFVYKGVFTTSITQNTAVSSGITLDKAYFKVLSMNLTYANGVSANVTDLKPGTGTGKLEFNIGVGKMYNVLSTEANTSAEVIVEFASTVSPLIP